MLAVIIVGINQWDEYTLPLIDEIKKFEPDVLIYVVDAGSKTPDPDTEGVTIIRSKTKSYAQAINEAARFAWQEGADWVLSMNNDVTCHGRFAYIPEALIPDAVYARQIIEEKGFVWFGNWIVLIPRPVWDAVGEFDEDYLVCGFEDADYSARAIAKGFPTRAIDLPFFHHWGMTRWSVPGYSETRVANIQRFAMKHGWTPGDEMKVTHD
jgi:GT2 family glycosyltransferase